MFVGGGDAISSSTTSESDDDDDDDEDNNNVDDDDASEADDDNDNDKKQVSQAKNETDQALPSIAFVARSAAELIFTGESVVVELSSASSEGPEAVLVTDRASMSQTSDDVAVANNDQSSSEATSSTRATVVEKPAATPEAPASTEKAKSSKGTKRRKTSMSRSSRRTNAKSPESRYDLVSAARFNSLLCSRRNTDTGKSRSATLRETVDIGRSRFADDTQASPLIANVCVALCRRALPIVFPTDNYSTERVALV